MRIFWLAAAALLLADPAGAAYFGKNKVQYKDFRWRVLETPHFQIHFYDREAALVEDAARLAERSYARLSATLEHEFVRRIPVIGGLYGVADRFVGLLDQKQGTDIGAMSPVWCFFGGDGAAVLALAPSAQPVAIEGRDYFAVLVPTAPVPFGGALIYVPAEWVRPAGIGVDRLAASRSNDGLRSSSRAKAG